MARRSHPGAAGVRLPTPQLVRQYAQVGNRWAFLLECGHTIKLRAGEIRGAPGKVAAIQCRRCSLQGGARG